MHPIRIVSARNDPALKVGLRRVDNASNSLSVLTRAVRVDIKLVALVQVPQHLFYTWPQLYVVGGWRLLPRGSAAYRFGMLGLRGEVDRAHVWARRIPPELAHARVLRRVEQGVVEVEHERELTHT